MWHSHWKLFAALCSTSVLHTIATLYLQRSSLFELHFCSPWLSLLLFLGASLHTFYREIAVTISLSLFHILLPKISKSTSSQLVWFLEIHGLLSHVTHVAFFIYFIEKLPWQFLPLAHVAAKMAHQFVLPHLLRWEPISSFFISHNCWLWAIILCYAPFVSSKVRSNFFFL